MFLEIVVLLGLHNVIRNSNTRITWFMFGKIYQFKVLLARFLFCSNDQIAIVSILLYLPSFKLQNLDCLHMWINVGALTSCRLLTDNTQCYCPYFHNNITQESLRLLINKFYFAMDIQFLHTVMVKDSCYNICFFEFLDTTTHMSVVIHKEFSFIY